MSLLAGQKLRLFELRLTYESGRCEDVEFAALDLDRAVQAVIDRKRAAGTPVAEVVSADGRKFNVRNE